MNNPLYSPLLEERLNATKSHPEFGRLTTDWPIACRGALNAFTVFLGPSMGTPEAGTAKLPGGNDRPVWRNAAGIGRYNANLDILVLNDEVLGESARDVVPSELVDDLETVVEQSFAIEDY